MRHGRLINSLFELFAAHAALSFVCNDSLPRHEQGQDFEDREVDDQHVHAVPLGFATPSYEIIKHYKKY